MIILSQRGPKWADVKLGASSLTMNKFGCTTTCLSMLSSYFNGYTRPDEIAGHKDWYTKDGLVLWTKLRLPMKFEKRTYGRDDAEFAKAIKDPRRAVMFEVQGKHWVVCLSKNLLGGYRIADPWDAKKKTTAAYGDMITGAAFFTL